MKNKKTGIALFVYNRPSHTKQVLKGLKQNNIDHLYIFADGPKDKENPDNVRKLRDIIHSIDWCETSILEAKNNIGCADSIVRGVNYVLDRHERIIVVEDDCVPSPEFISFMEKSFDKYENNERVMNVTGYSLPIEIPDDYKHDVYFSYRSSSWGWGTWRHAWEHFERDENLLSQIQASPELKNRVERAGPDLIPMLKKQIEGKLDAWDVYWSINIAQNDGVCLKPVNSFIKNIGHDDSGIHSGNSKKFDVNLRGGSIKSLNYPNKVEVNEVIQKRYRDFYRSSLLRRILNSIRGSLSSLKPST